MVRFLAELAQRNENCGFLAKRLKEAYVSKTEIAQICHFLNSDGGN